MRYLSCAYNTFMRIGSLSIPGIASGVIIPALLTACAGSGELAQPDEQQSCPAPQVLVCRGGTVSKTGRVRDREPRICQCQPPDQLD